MKKFTLIAAAATVAALPAPAGAATSKYAPTDGVVCQPHGVAKHWGIQYNDDGAAMKFVKLRGTLAKGVCVEYVAGKPIRFTTRAAYVNAPTTGLVCTPQGVATGWGIEYDERTLTTIKFVRLADGVRLGASCIRYADGKPQAFVASPFAR